MIFGKQREKKRKRKHVKMLIKRPVKRLRWKGQPVKGLRVTISERSFLRRLRLDYTPSSYISSGKKKK